MVRRGHRRGGVAAPGSRILTLAALFDRYAADQPGLWWTIEVKVDPTDEREVATRDKLTRAVVSARGPGLLRPGLAVDRLDRPARPPRRRGRGRGPW